MGCGWVGVGVFVGFDGLEVLVVLVVGVFVVDLWCLVGFFVGGFFCFVLF